MNTTEKIVKGWASYVEANSLNRKTQSYHKAMHAYVNGCNAVLGEQGLPPVVQIYIMCGRDLLDLPHAEVEHA